MKYVLVADATNSSNKLIAKKFADFGYNLVLLGKDSDDLLVVVDELSTSHPEATLLPIQMNFSQSEERAQLQEKLSSLNIQIDVQVNDSSLGAMF